MHANDWHVLFRFNRLFRYNVNYFEKKIATASFPRVKKEEKKSDHDPKYKGKKKAYKGDIPSKSPVERKKEALR